MSRSRQAVAPSATLDGLAKQLAEAPHCQRFAEVWRQWRGDKPLPTRADVDPIMLGATMAAVNIFEVPEPGRIIFRLAATNLEDLTGRSRKGQNLVDLAMPEDRAERIQRHQNILKTPCGLWLVRRSISTSGAILTMSALLLPVTESTAVRPTFVYAATDIARTGDWLDTEVPEALEIAADFKYLDIGFALPGL